MFLELARDGMEVKELKEIYNGILRSRGFEPLSKVIGMTLVYINNRCSVPVRDSVIIRDGDVVTVEFRTKQGNYAKPFLVGSGKPDVEKLHLLLASELAFQFIFQNFMLGTYPTAISEGLHNLVRSYGCELNEHLSIGGFYFNRPSPTPYGRFASKPITKRGIYYINPVVFCGSSRLYVDRMGVYCNGLVAMAGRMIRIDEKNSEVSNVPSLQRDDI